MSAQTMSTTICTTSTLTPFHGTTTHTLPVRLINQLKAHITFLHSFANELETEAIQEMAAARKEKRFMDKIVRNVRVRQAALQAWGVEGLNAVLRETNVRFLTKRRIAAEKWSVALQAREEIRKELNMAKDTRVKSLLDERTAFYSTIAQERFLEAATERIAAFDEELGDIKNSLALLLRQRNMLVTAYRLPVELLCHIFSDLSQLEPHYYPDPADHEKYASGVLRPRMGWIKAATQVCGNWRQVALADTSLWRITTTSLGREWEARMLRLSGGRPTEFDVWDGWEGEAWIPDPSLQPMMLSIAKLQIIGPDLDQGSWRKLAVPPAIRVLRLHTFSDNHGYPSVPDPIFYGGLGDTLRELYMQNFRVGAVGQRSLFLYVGPQWLLEPSSQPGKPCNQAIFFWVDEDDITPDNLAPIERPHLANVEIFSSWDAIFILLLRLRASPTVRYTLASECPFDSPPEPNVAVDIKLSLANYLTTNRETSILSQMKTVEWRSCSPSAWRGRIAGTNVPAGSVDPVFRKTLVLSAWREDNPDYLLSDYVGYGSPPNPDFHFAFDFSDESVEYCIIDEILPLDIFPSARCLSLQSGRLRFDIIDWRGLFESVSMLTWLRLDRNVAEMFLNSRSEPWKSLPKRVKTIALLGVNWGLYSGEERGPDRSLARLWTARSKTGSSLERVIVGHTSIRYDYFNECVHDAGVVLAEVHRPEWLDEGHEDWDEQTDW
ncbi:unnamed protein product [Peniophora sp. CBMAI 1063]|nr:unnamed protein product [Peniophora sp. CBMAI 1063]